MVGDWLSLMLDDHPATLILLILAFGVVILLVIGWVLEWITGRNK